MLGAVTAVSAKSPTVVLSCNQLEAFKKSEQNTEEKVMEITNDKKSIGLKVKQSPSYYNLM